MIAQGLYGAGVAKQNVDRWIDKAKREARRSGPSPVTVPALAGRLVALDRLMRSAPDYVLNAYSRLKEEEDLVAGTDLRVAQLEQERWSWVQSNSLDPAAMVLPLAVEIRATDALLRMIRPREAPSQPNVEWKAKGHDALVVPSRQRRLGRRGDRDGQPYQRRGVLSHRILPMEIGRFRVRAHGGGAVALEPPLGPPAFKGGAALFKDLLTFTVDRRDPGLFTVVECRAEAHHEQIEESLRHAHDEACSSLVWPELTISPTDRHRIERWLATRLLSDRAHFPKLDLVVAGSWHEGGPGKTVNRGYVLDGLGNLLLTFDKLIAYHGSDFGSEDILESDQLEVLVLDDLLVAFGICRDFAEIKPTNPFGQLEVDLIIIPSMGNATTANGHRINAEVVAERTTARSFIVQQRAPSPSGPPLGFVIHDGKETQQFTVFAAY